MLYLGTDHRGFELKEALVEKLKAHSYEFDDLGAMSFDADDDYADIALLVAKAVAGGPKHRGILLCGSGAGVCIAANKVRGIRAVLADRLDVVRLARTDDDVNVLCLPASFIGAELAWELVEVFLSTDFIPSERHLRRLKTIETHESNSINQRE